MQKNMEDFIIENNIIKGPLTSLSEEHNFGDLILDTLKSNPHHVSQIDVETGLKTTFAQMKDRSVRCALWMLQQGIGRGDIVTICTHNILDDYAPMFASFFIGAVCNFWGHDVTVKTAQYLISYMKPKVIFSCEDAIDTLLKAAKLENISTKFVVFGTQSNAVSFIDVIQDQSEKEVETFKPLLIKSPQDAALIIMSSGTTGLQKGIMHSYKTLVLFASSCSPNSLDGLCLWYSRPEWMSSFANRYGCLFSHGTRVIHANFDVEESCRIIEKFKIEELFLTPFMITAINKAKVIQKYNLNSLKYVATVGAKINPVTFKEFKQDLPNAFIYQFYGLTEGGSYISSQTKKSQNINSVGFLNTCTELKIISEDFNKILGPNEPGEVRIKSPTLMLGYYNYPNATHDAFDDDGWLRTGDKGYYDENGEIFLVDRFKDTIFYGDVRISPSEIEEVLYTHPGVMEAAVVAMPYEDIEWPVAFVKKVPKLEVTEEELIHLSLTLGEPKKLRGGVQFVEEFPKTASGKILRRELKERAKALTKFCKI